MMKGKLFVLNVTKDSLNYVVFPAITENLLELLEYPIPTICHAIFLL